MIQVTSNILILVRGLSLERANSNYWCWGTTNYRIEYKFLQAMGGAPEPNPLGRFES